ncbi:NUDIX domain-containing protein [Anaerocolumna sedimenticola]|uniref:NUDIX domain-containing protein n=1 Tax=Anaerocolumna sedimenticola TaxID=2696063 RepID=A0A6P1TRH2_9FIRM|nr:NUDIX hydrolase [Anaerocolumna sedimenticola]QHQ62947.1 NUDIX domain-containing protein [Anaerocolumna sedimenticola]
MEYYKELRKFVGHKPIILPGAVVIIVNGNGEILLQERENNFWGLPGGLMDLGESLADTAKREVFEETGLSIQNLVLLDVLSGPEYYNKMPNEDELYSVTAIYTTTDYTGELIPDMDESKSLKFYEINCLPERMEQEYKDCIKIYLRSRT